MLLGPGRRLVIGLTIGETRKQYPSLRHSPPPAARRHGRVSYLPITSDIRRHFAIAAPIIACGLTPHRRDWRESSTGSPEGKAVNRPLRWLYASTGGGHRIAPTARNRIRIHLLILAGDVAVLVVWSLDLTSPLRAEEAVFGVFLALAVFVPYGLGPALRRFRNLRRFTNYQKNILNFCSAMTRRGRSTDLMIRPKSAGVRAPDGEAPPRQRMISCGRPNYPSAQGHKDTNLCSIAHKNVSHLPACVRRFGSLGAE